MAKNSSSQVPQVPQVSSKLALELLNLAPPKQDETDSRPLGERLQDAVACLAALVEEANAHLKKSEVAQRVAEALAADSNKRGSPRLRVATTGEVVLEFYLPKSQRPPSQSRTSLPLLEELRQKARDMRIDISHLGQKRRAIHDYLQEVEMRRAQAAALNSDEDEGQPMAAGPDELTVTPPKEGPKPPKRRRVALVNPNMTPSEAPPDSRPSPNLTAIMENAPEVDLDELMGDLSPPPQEPEKSEEPPEETTSELDSLLNAN